MELVRSSGVKRVLRAGRRKTYRESMRQAPEEYKTLWEELQVKPDAKCQTAMERGLTGETSLECIDVVPVVLPAGRPEEPYWAEQDLRNDLAEVTGDVTQSQCDQAFLVIAPEDLHFIQSGCDLWQPGQFLPQSFQVLPEGFRCNQTRLDGAHFMRARFVEAP